VGAAPANTLHVLAHLTQADFLERFRRQSFLVIVATAVLAGYLFVPPVDSGYRVLQVGVWRGVYNSAWIGLMFGLIAALHLPFVGFYLVKNAVERDRQTGVGEIVATTPIHKLVYVLGKFLSNLAVLVLILAVMTLMAGVMQLVRAEERTLDVPALVAPIWLMGLPMLAIAAAMAVLFECTPFLRGGLGNVIYFFLWLITLISVVSAFAEEESGLAQPRNDPYGYTRQLADIQQQVLAVDPNAELGSGLIMLTDNKDTLLWEGPRWPVRVLGQRLAWTGIAAVLVAVAVAVFDRFDPARSKRPSRSVAEPRPARVPAGSSAREKGMGGDAGATHALPVAHLTRLARAPGRGQFHRVLAAELKLMLKGQSVVWYAGVIGLDLGCMVSPSELVHRALLLAVWVWPVLIWSQMGSRENRRGTEHVVFSVPCPALRQLPAVRLAGVVVAVVAASGAWIRLGMTEHVTSVAAGLVGALFTPALGVWTGSRRAIEAVYLLWWYIGLVNRTPLFDYAGATAGEAASGMPIAYLVGTAALLAVAMLGRWWQLRR